MRVVLIRHAQTQWNSQGLIQGRQDSPVTEQGERQVTALLAGLCAAGIEPAYVFSSPAPRAQQMAVPLARHFGADLALREELQEQSFGIYEGRPHAEYPFADDAHAVPREGESLMQAAQRLTGFMQTLPQLCSADTVALLSHGQVIQAFIAWQCETSLENMARYHHPNGSFSLLEVSAGQCRVVRWGVATHLLKSTRP